MRSQFRRGLSTLGSAICRKKKGLNKLRKSINKPEFPLDFDTEPFDYYGFVRTSFPIEIDGLDILRYFNERLVQRRVEVENRPRHESQYFYIWDTAAYQQLMNILSEDHPLIQWAQTRLDQGRLYTTCQQAEEGWRPWCTGARPSQHEVEKVICKYIGFEQTIKEMQIAIADLVQGWTNMEGIEPERQALYITGSHCLIKHIVCTPLIWMRFLKYMEDSLQPTGAFDILDVRQVYNCPNEPAEIVFGDIIPVPAKKDIEDFEDRSRLLLDLLPHTIPDWYDEFPTKQEFWDSLPEPELHPWDRKHEWYKLCKPQENRLVYFCDLPAYNILNKEFNTRSELGAWTNKCLRGGKLYVRDWDCPNRRGLPLMSKDIIKTDKRGWKVLPWPDSNLDRVSQLPALSNAEWPNLDYAFVIDRYLKENVFVTGDPAVAAEVSNSALRNWLLKYRNIHIVHDVRQVYDCHGKPTPLW